MNQSFLEFYDSFFPPREESAGSPLAVWLDRLLYFFILLTAIGAPVSIAITNIGWLAGMATWLARAFVRPRPKLFRTPLDLALFGFFGWCLLSCVFSYAPDLSFDRLRVTTLFPIAYLVAQNVRSAKTVKILAAALILSCLASVVWTFVERIPGRGVQVFGIKPESTLAVAGLKDGDTLLRINGKKFSQPEQLLAALEQNQTIKLQFYRPDFYMEIPLEGKLLAGESAAQKIGFASWKPSRNWRSAGFYGHYATYAEALQLILSLAFGIFIALPDKRSRLALLLLLSLAGMSLALLMTATRASQAAFLVSALAIVALGASRKTLLGVLAVFLPVAVVGAIYLQQSRNVGFVDRSDDSTVWRMTVYREGVGLLTKSARHLTVGVGIDSINRYRCDWGLFDNCKLPPGHFHSTPLQIAVETGLPALALWLLVVFLYGKTLVQMIRKTREDWLEKGILLGAFGGLIGFFTSGAVHYNLGDSEVAMVFYVIMGLSLAIWHNHRQIRSESERNI